MAATSESLRKRRTTTEQRKASTSVATPAIHSVSKIVELLKPWELSDTNRFKTYQLMMQDPDIFSAVESRITAVEVAQSNPRFQYNKNSERSVWLKNYLEYCLATMKKSSRQLGRDCGEFIFNGISPFEVTADIASEGDFNGYFTLTNLIYIDPLTLDKTKPFVTDDGGRNITYWRQLLSAFMDTNGELQKNVGASYGAKEIDARKVVKCSYSASSSRPLGTSPLDAAYATWREKCLIQEYLLMGIQRDLSGLPVLYVPLDLFEKAKDPNSDAYATMTQLTEHMMNLHSSDQSFMIMPSDGHSESGTGLRQYEVSFKGVEGNDKQFDLVQIIDQKKKTIYTVLGASNLIAGENGGGSYNLLEGKSAQKSYYAKRDNLIIEDMWNKQIIPLLFRLNGFKEKPSDVPKYLSSEVQPLSADEQGKFAQRVASVGMMPLVPETVNHFLAVMGSTYRVDESMSTEDLREIMTNYTSNAGEGEGTSGTGNSQSGGIGSAVNSENAS